MSFKSFLNHWLKGDYAFGQTYAGRQQKRDSSQYQDYLNYIRGWSPSDGLPYAPDPNVMGTGSYHDAYNRYNSLVDEYNRYQEDVKWNRETEENWKMVRHEEDYNSIANQIKQFEENGLSKNLIYGSGNGGFIASSGGQVPSMGDYESEAQDPEARRPGLSLDSLMSLAGFAQQIRSGKLQNDLTSANISRVNAGNLILGLQAKLLGKEVSDLDDKYNYQSAWRQANLNLMGQQSEKLSQEIEGLKSEKEYRDFLRKYGLNPQDPTLARLFATMSANPEMSKTIADTLAVLVSSAVISIPAALKGLVGGTMQMPEMIFPNIKSPFNFR